MDRPFGLAGKVALVTGAILPVAGGEATAF